MNGGKFAGVVILGLALVIVGLSAFTVNERELAIKLQLGEVVTADYEPGLHFKWPLVQNFFVKFRIVDPVRFYTSTGGALTVANGRLSEIIKNAIVTEFGKRSVREAISVERAELMRDMRTTAAAASEDLGVSLIDFRVKQVEFMDEVRSSVYLQMAAERARIAAERRAEGRAGAEEKRAAADRTRTVILADAYRDGQKIKGAGDAQAAEIYATAYNKDPEFYAFYRSIDAYRKSMGKAGDVLILDPNNEFFRYLNQSDGEQ